MRPAVKVIEGKLPRLTIENPWGILWAMDRESRREDISRLENFVGV